MDIKRIEQLQSQFKTFKENLKTTQHPATREAVSALSNYSPAFQYWALMKCALDDSKAHAQNLTKIIRDLEDRINELLGQGYEVMQERDVLKQKLKAAKSLTVPEGFVVRPKEPSEEMIQRGTKANSECLNENAPLGERLYRHPAIEVYKAMISEQE